MFIQLLLSPELLSPELILNLSVSILQASLFNAHLQVNQQVQPGREEGVKCSGMPLTCRGVDVVPLPVVGAATLGQPGGRRRAAVAQGARAAADGRVRAVVVLRALEAVVPLAGAINPAVAVLTLAAADGHATGEEGEQ